MKEPNQLHLFSATDADADTLNFFVTGTDANSFEITSAGALAFKNTPSYDSKKRIFISSECI